MGMYDYIVCKMPLPGTKPAWLEDGHPFQTKSLDCEMVTYTIEADGQFSKADFTDVVEFYNTNIISSGPALYTRNGEDIESVEYRAVVVDGTVTRLEQTEYSTQAAFPVSRQRIGFPVGREAQRQPQDWEGKRLYVLWGGQNVGYWVKVLLQRGRKVCIEYEADCDFRRKGDIDILDMGGIDRVIWESEEEALQTSRQEKDAWDKERAEYDAYVDSTGGVRRVWERRLLF